MTVFMGLSDCTLTLVRTGSRTGNCRLPVAWGEHDRLGKVRFLSLHFQVTR